MPPAKEELQIGQPFTFPNGATIRNRLVKSAMAEGYMMPDLLPGEKYNANYSRWAQGGWGMLITGNYMVDPTAPSGPGVLVLNDPIIPHEVQLSKLRAFATAARADGKTKVLAQLCHPGRAAIHLPILPFTTTTTTTTTKKQNLAPSAVRISFGEGLVARAMAAMLCGTPREMTPADMDAVVDKFAAAARLMSDAGLDGVELHGAHGYLLSQFLSAEANTRTDEYGGSAIKRTKFVTQVIEAVRATVPSGFIVGIKLNSVDYQTDRHGARAEAGEGEVIDKEAQLRECIEQFGAIAAAGVDFVEVSGGTWADPQMSSGSPKSTRTKAREAFFLSFAEMFRRSHPQVPLMVTGGFCSRAGMEEAVAGGGTDLIGVGRASCVCPSLPDDVVLNRELDDDEARVVVKKYPVPWYLGWMPKMVGVGYENNVYMAMIQALGTEREIKKTGEMAKMHE